MREMVGMPQLLTVLVESTSVNCHIVVVHDASERSVLYSVQIHRDLVKISQIGHLALWRQPAIVAIFMVQMGCRGTRSRSI